MSELQDKFDALQKELMEHRKAYYVDNAPTITDFDYDMLEMKSLLMAKELGFRADRWLGPEENEKHHVHWMVGYGQKG